MRRSILFPAALVLLAGCHQRPQASLVTPYHPPVRQDVPPLAVPGDTQEQRAQRLRVWCDARTDASAYPVCGCFAAGERSARRPE